jgi:hypothetical protein
VRLEGRLEVLDARADELVAVRGEAEDRVHDAPDTPSPINLTNCRRSRFTCILLARPVSRVSPSYVQSNAYTMHYLEIEDWKVRDTRRVSVWRRVPKGKALSYGRD